MNFDEDFDKRIKECGWTEVTKNDIKKYKKQVCTGNTISIINNQRTNNPVYEEVILEYLEGSVTNDDGSGSILFGISVENGDTTYFDSFDDLFLYINKLYK